MLFFAIFACLNPTFGYLCYRIWHRDQRNGNTSYPKTIAKAKSQQLETQPWHLRARDQLKVGEESLFFFNGKPI